MYLVYVFEDNLHWVFWDSIPWEQLKPELLDSICVDVSNYVKAHPIYNEYGTLQNDILFPVLDYARFVHDMIIYSQYITNRLAIYFVKMPR